MNAREFAIAAHGSQRYGENPYSVHLDAVAKILKGYGDDAVAIGYLHDVLEDTAVTKAELVRHFGEFVAECIAFVTDEQGQNRKERKAKTNKKLKAVGAQHHIALVVKTADRLANVTACRENKNMLLLNMYRKEHRAFKSAVYRPGLCDDLWQQIENILLGELPGSI